eukprot:CAMPEP_0185727338 /NCGR_PEP_ID=MMETSP1171-20130828/3051_1 /TAXON_ID=374046 /ORGANISM="Helicotheca tamensis, Strain CCMP826" /LENGTH=629 /DNA_ID=CAMNT_0028395877 /DNA_START=87 /DNA_END=1976 /DNA_ORIENTATION=-
MRPASAGPVTTLHRRRGTRGGRRSSSRITLTPNAVLVLMALCLSVFVMGLLVGSRLFAAPPSSSPPSESSHVSVDSVLHDRSMEVSPPDDNPKLRKPKIFEDIGAPPPAEDPNKSLRAPPKQTASSNYPYDLTPAPSNHDFAAWNPPGGNRYQEYKDGEAPYVITPSLKQQSDNVARTRRTHVKNAMKHAWNGYKTYAYGHDEVAPLRRTFKDGWGGMGTTLVDSLDTLWLMDMKTEFWEARDWVRDELVNAIGRSVSTFETTIRSLGGLLAAYDWSGDKVFLEKALDLGERLFGAFARSDIPSNAVNLASKQPDGFGSTNIAEAGTLQVEFRYLAMTTGRMEFKTKSEKVFELLHNLRPHNGLYPYKINKSPGFVNSVVTFGAMGDSFYEYMLKIWLQGGKKEQMYRDMWDESMTGIHEELMQQSSPNGLWYIAEKKNGRIDNKFDHLVCFMGGALALGAYTDPRGLDSERAQRDLKTARQLAYTCYQMYARQTTGIAPEMIRFDGFNDFSGSPNYYILRPETVETFFILNYLTGDPIYREWGWEIFQSIEKFCKTDIAYGSLKNVNQPGSVEDRMESFFLAETLKYLYLLFDPDTEVDILNKHVFNTEAHPTRVFPVLKKESPEMIG